MSVIYDLPGGITPEMVIENLTRQVVDEHGPHVQFVHTYTIQSGYGLARIYGRVEGLKAAPWHLVAYQYQAPQPLDLPSYWRWATAHEGDCDRQFHADLLFDQLDLPDSPYDATADQRRRFHEIAVQAGWHSFEIMNALDPEGRHHFREDRE